MTNKKKVTPHKYQASVDSLTSDLKKSESQIEALSVEEAELQTKLDAIKKSKAEAQNTAENTRAAIKALEDLIEEKQSQPVVNLAEVLRSLEEAAKAKRQPWTNPYPWWDHYPHYPERPRLGSPSYPDYPQPLITCDPLWKGNTIGQATLEIRSFDKS